MEVNSRNNGIYHARGGMCPDYYRLKPGAQKATIKGTTKKDI
jgi:hypothetical protein